MTTQTHLIRACHDCAKTRGLTHLDKAPRSANPACALCGATKTRFPGRTAIYSLPRPSPRLERFLRHVAATDADAELADAAEVLSEMSDARLALVCGEEPGERVNSCPKTLAASCRLRHALAREIDDLELAPGENAVVTIAEVLCGA